MATPQDDEPVTIQSLAAAAAADAAVALGGAADPLVPRTATAEGIDATAIALELMLSTGGTQGPPPQTAAEPPADAAPAAASHDDTSPAPAAAAAAPAAPPPVPPPTCPSADEIYSAAKNGRAASLASMLAHPEAAPNGVGSTGWAAILGAAYFNQLETTELLLTAGGTDPNHQSSKGSTALVLAAQEGHRRIADRLLRHPDIDANKVDATGATPLYTSCEKGMPQVVDRLLEHDGVLVNRCNSNGVAPIFIAAQLGHAGIVTRLLEHADIDVDRVNKNLATPLYIAVFTRRTAAALALLRGGADPNLKNSKDLAPLHVARDARDAELVATLIVRGADASEVFTPLVAACTRGYAHAAREVVLTSDVDEEEIPALHRAILQGSDVAAAITPSDGPSPASCTDVTNQAALFYAIELGETGYLAPLLGAGSEKLLAAARAAVESGDDEPDEAAAAAEADAAADRPAASAADAAACGYVSGSRYCHFAHALVVSGLTETSDLAASLVSKYLGTAAACVYFDRAPAAFDALKAACVARLSRIAEPLEALYTAEDLGQRLGRIGEAYFNHEVRLDDAGLMPTPRKFRSHTTPEMVSYEAYIMYVIWLISVALDASFVFSLKRALAKFGNKVSVKPAPVKTIARMRNKLGDPDDHALKKRPRPMHNIDTVRAGVVVKDASLMEEVFDTIGAEVGPWLRVKNNYREAFDSKESYGYRALLGNLKYSSGMTCSELFVDNAVAWNELRASLPGQSDRARTDYALGALRAADCRAMPVNIAAEVQLIYEPYVTQGRIRSHLHYKVVRCRAANELVREASSRYEKSYENIAAVEAIRKIVPPQQQRQLGAGARNEEVPAAACCVVC